MTGSVHAAEDLERLARSRDVRRWVAEGLLPPDRAAAIQAAHPSRLVTGSVFLRVALFGLVAVAVACVRIGMAVGARGDTGVLDLGLAAGLAVLAEFLIRQNRWHGYGIDEALLAAAVVSLSIGLVSLHLSAGGGGPRWDQAAAMAAGGGAAALLSWRYGRVGLLAAAWLLLAGAVLPCNLGESANRTWIAAVALAALGSAEVAASAALISPASREALRAFAVTMLYLAVNLAIVGAVRGEPLASGRYDPSFRWLCLAATVVLPPALLAAAVLGRSRAFLRLGLLAGGISLASVKPFLGWARHDWDPLQFGVLLIAASWLVDRWLEGGLDAMRDGFTARDPRTRSGGPELTALASLATGLPGAAPKGPVHPPTPPPAAGGRFGGGGASGGF